MISKNIDPFDIRICYRLAYTVLMYSEIVLKEIVLYNRK